MKNLDPEKLGQVFMVGLPGPTLDESTRNLISRYHVNNFIIFKRNVEAPAQLRALCQDIRHFCLDAGLAAPLISIDQEGGTVARLPEPFTQFPDARKLAESAEPETALRNYARVCAQELLDVGVNMNLSPVLDVCPAGEGFFMERRALGGDPQTVGALGSLIIREMQEQKVAACAKHFPGLGGATIDPHHHLPVVTRARSQMRSVDLLPFQDAIVCGVAAIMTSHTIYTELDADHPATLSKEILTGLLRTELGYDGVIVTDDLEMGAIENKGPLARAGVQAFRAGADMLLICHEHDKVVRSFEALQAAVADGTISGRRVTESVTRIARLQQRFAV